MGWWGGVGPAPCSSAGAGDREGRALAKEKWEAKRIPACRALFCLVRGERELRGGREAARRLAFTLPCDLLGPQGSSPWDARARRTSPDSTRACLREGHLLRVGRRRAARTPFCCFLSLSLPAPSARTPWPPRKARLRYGPLCLPVSRAGWPRDGTVGDRTHTHTAAPQLRTRGPLSLPLSLTPIAPLPSPCSPQFARPLSPLHL